MLDVGCSQSNRCNGVQKERRKNGPEAIFKSVKDKKFSNCIRHQPTDLRNSVNTKQDKCRNKHTSKINTKPYLGILQMRHQSQKQRKNTKTEEERIYLLSCSRTVRMKNEFSRWLLKKKSMKQHLYTTKKKNYQCRILYPAKISSKIRSK